MASKVIMGTTLLLPSIVILVFLKGTCLLFTSAFIIAVQPFQDIIRTEHLSNVNHYREFIIAELQYTDVVFVHFRYLSSLFPTDVLSALLLAPWFLFHSYISLLVIKLDETIISFILLYEIIIYICNYTIFESLNFCTFFKIHSIIITQRSTQHCQRSS